MYKLSVHMPTRAGRTCRHVHSTSLHTRQAFDVRYGRFGQNRRSDKSQQLFREHTMAMSDVLVCLNEQTSSLNTPAVTSRVACVVSVSVCGALEWLQGPNIFRSWCHTFMISAAACKLALPLLTSLRQPIRTTGPSSHFSKAGTPTAAGCVFLPLACGVACAHCPTARVACACALILVASAVGFIDDYFTVNPLSRERRGLVAAEQLFMQVMSGAVLATIATSFVPQHLVTTGTQGMLASVKVHITPWLSLAAPPFLYQLLCAFTYVSEVNAVNLTDGLDGLAATCTALVLSGTGLGLHGPSCQDLQTLCAALSGAICGFFLHNRHPAAAFMGNCGSHGLGAAIAVIAALAGAHGVVGLLSLVLAIEAGSTAVQLGWFSWTRRRSGVGVRLLRMAPVHHHLEMCGWHEVSVVALATAVQLALVVLATKIWC